MNPRSLLGVLAGLGAGACASPAPPPPAAAAAEQARRDERLKVMQQYWYDQTSAPPEVAGAAEGSPALLDYPAGNYAGINFAARRAVDPTLAEPPR